MVISEFLSFDFQRPQNLDFLADRCTLNNSLKSIFHHLKKKREDCWLPFEEPAKLNPFTPIRYIDRQIEDRPEEPQNCRHCQQGFSKNCMAGI